MSLDTRDKSRYSQPQGIPQLTHAILTHFASCSDLFLRRKLRMMLSLASGKPRSQAEYILITKEASMLKARRMLVDTYAANLTEDKPRWTRTSLIALVCSMIATKNCSLSLLSPLSFSFSVFVSLATK